MSWLRRHPRDRDLNRFADGALGEPVHGRVAAHLADCTRCRDEVALIRRMSDVARTIPTPIATDEVLRRALARRTGGERVLLPLSDAGAPRPAAPRRFAPAAIAALLTLMIASLVVSVRVLEADRPGLQVLPERPEAGETLTVLYDGGALFDDETHLALRARYRTGNERDWQLLAGVLVRGEDGRFRAEVPLPDSVVYAAFAVEELGGGRLDSNNRELWDVMVHGDDHRPTLAAMTARLRDLERRDWGGAYEVALAMTEAYPDAPQSWAIRFSYELTLFDQDSIMAAHSDEFTRLEQLVSASPRPDPEQVAWLATYAVGLGKLDVAGNWVRLAVAEAPHLAATAEAQAMLLGSETAERALPRLESAWQVAGGGSVALARVGWQAALIVKDPEATLVWMRRFLEINPAQDQAVIPAAYALAGHGDGGALQRWIEDYVRLVRPVTERPRPLEMPLEDHAREVSARDQRLLADLASKALEIGHREEAQAFAARAAELAWDPGALLKSHDVLARAGDRDGALRALSRAWADPAGRDTAEARAFALGIEGNPDWERYKVDAELALFSHVMDEAIVRYVDESIRLTEPDGAIRTLGELIEGQPAVVAFIRRYSGPALTDLPRIAVVADAVQATGGRFFLIDVGSEGPLTPYLDFNGVDIDLYTDRFGSARDAFRSASAPDYYVLDASGRIRFEHSQVGELLRQYEFVTSGRDYRIAAAP